MTRYWYLLLLFFVKKINPLLGMLIWPLIMNVEYLCKAMIGTNARKPEAGPK